MQQKINKKHFRELTADRQDSLRLLNKSSMSGIRDSVVERYSEQAHFIYELLQNGDDVAATSVRFVLRKDGFYFIHNGTIPFTVTPPNATPAGHINAITSIGASSKKDENYKIGKFGIGFKSVFQYTDTPEIYADNVAFRIRDLIVPELLEETNHPLRHKQETLFYFPFNQKKKIPITAYKEISSRLIALKFPLLFLNHLQEITWETSETSGFYKKNTQNELNGITKIKATNQAGQREITTDFLKITEKEPTFQLPYALVFRLNDSGQIDNQHRYFAHCYFPTRVQMPFGFLLHAPFLLTDSREGIKLDNDWNNHLIRLLSRLLFLKIKTLKTLGYLNTSFFEILPIQEKAFKDDISQFFQPFFEETYLFFKNTEIDCLPTQGTDYTGFERGFMTSNLSLMALLNDEQLAVLIKQSDAKWIFFEKKTSQFVIRFFEKILLERQGNSHILNIESLFKKLEKEFLKAQTDKWLMQLYNVLSQLPTSEALYAVPFVRLENNEMVTVRDEWQAPNAYLPTDLTTNYPTVKASLANDSEARTFLEKIGLQPPTLSAELAQFVLPKYRQKTDVLPTVEDLEKLYLHYHQCSAEEGETLLEELKSLQIVQAVNTSDGNIVGAIPNEVYWKSADLEQYFERNDDVFWLPFEEVYGSLLERLDRIRLKRFFIKIGVRTAPRFIEVEDTLSDEERLEYIRTQNPQASFAMWETVSDVSLEGLVHFFKEMTIAKAHFLWTFFKHIFNKKTLPITGRFEYEYEEIHELEIEAHWLRLLRNEAWLLDNNNQLRAASDMSWSDLNAEYLAVDEHPLREILFQKKSKISRLEGLTAEERTAMELGQRLLKAGLTTEVFKDFEQWKKVQVDRKKPKTSKKKKRSKRTDIDTDEFNPAFLSSEELIEKKEALRQKMEADLAEELDILERIELLKLKIKESDRYSFGWYRALMELEYILALEQIGKDRSFRIEFKSVQPEADTAKTILLQKPNKDIPMTIEMMGDMTLKIDLGIERKTLEIEVVSIKDFSLRAKLKSPKELEGIDFEEVRSGVLEIQNTIFTLEELVRSFTDLGYAETDNLQELLPKNLHFVFGPPGTGKTTHLANEEILPLMLNDESLKILVLTPTNKSADVLAKKILSLSEEPPRWLLRFGASGDNVVENAGLLCDNTLELDDYERCCVITTATRFPYDGFDRGADHSKLKNIDWDVVIIDEVSMITLPMITYIIYQLPETKFIIAGDPFQIEPIVYAEEWKGENIYTLVNLNSFDPKVQADSIVPHAYPILNLGTQYRSIPSIGQVFSAFAYENRLKHYRAAKMQRPLKIDDLPLQPVNIIRFPVNKLETLYRPQRLRGSHYHIYSALLTAELVKYLVEQIFKNHIKTDKTAKAWRIGIICPYKAQAQMVDKIIAAQKVFKPKISVSCGTIHSFQGDECDIMINLFNPPLYISKSPNMFLNRRNIVNVAISRAKDYLILLIPDKNTDKVRNLEEIGRMLDFIRGNLKGSYWEKDSAKIEEAIFNSANYLENNTFATTHQSINVYTEPEKQFEIRVEEMAVDVQVRSEFL